MDNRSMKNPPEETAEDLYENAPFGYVSFLADGTIFKINKTLLDLLGFEREEIVDVKRIQHLFRIGGKIYFETHFFPLIKMQGFVKEINFDLVRKDGSFFPALINVDQITAANSSISSYRASVIDITDRKKYEKVLIESKQKAEKATRAKAEFLSTISHEIRTPLNAIVGIGNLIHKTSLDDLQKEYARILQLSSESLLELVNNLLDLSKLEAQKVKLEERVFNLKDLLKVLIHSFEIKAAEKNIELKTEFPEELPEHLLGDPVKLNQVLTNLIGNAIKFTGRGYVKLKIEIPEAGDKKIFLKFTVCDTGIGIPEDKLDMIFAEFSQASYDVNLEYGGTGLGLTISQKLLQIHGSELIVDSEEGKGSEFSFELRYKLPAEAPVKITKAKANEALRKIKARVLVVDDNPTNLFITSQYLQNWDLEHSTVNSGTAAIEEVKKQQYDVILMDLHMPKMNGYETSTQINQLDPENSPVIIALSASGRGDVNLKMKRAGISAYVPKPFDPLELQEVIIQFLNGERPDNLRTSFTDVPEKTSAERNADKEPSSEKNPISFDISTLRKVSQKDPEVLSKLINNSLKGIKKYRREFEAAAGEENEKALNELIHKNTMTLHMVKAERLSKYNKEYKELLSSPETTSEQLNAKRLEVLAEFDEVILGVGSSC